MQFKIEQIALAPTLADRARHLLEDMGLTEWVTDTVRATGTVGDMHCSNVANLAFNYESGGKDLELEILEYVSGPNWMSKHPTCVSHLGMHCAAEELEEWKIFFNERGIFVAQEVFTDDHTNQYLVDNRRTYHYCIFNTRWILGVDIKMIVRIDP